jgi:hypothetical protein
MGQGMESLPAWSQLLCYFSDTMAVEFISGKPGGGKSLRGVMLLIEELRTSNRNIVTNLAMKVPDLCEYLHKEFDCTFNCLERLRVLTPEQTMCFWLFPGIGIDIDPFKKAKWTSPTKRSLDVPDFSLREHENDPGTLFIIDEAHLFFAARNWANNGTDGFFYLSQHRKYRDDVILITQFIENVDKQFRTVAQSYSYIKNRYKENLPIFGGLFRSMPGFTQTTFPEPYRTGMLSVDTTRFTLDVQGICQVYNTAAGVGVVGKGGAEQTKKKGLPVYLTIVPLLLIGLGIWAVPKLLVRATLAGTKGASDLVANVTTNQTSRGDSRPVVKADLPGSGSNSRPASPIGESEKISKTDVNPEQVYLSGWARLPGKQLVVYLTDGSFYTAEDKELEGFPTARSVKISGKEYTFPPPGWRPKGWHQ